MATKTTRDHLLALLDAIRQERQAAIALNISAMHTATQKKEEILQFLAHLTEIDEADRPIARQVSHENKRNAFLFKSTLGWIRETMEFLGKRTSLSTYSANAQTVRSGAQGRLLSGKI